jgi:putative ABC transport system substrate-binding protein
MHRRDLIILLGAAATWPLAARAQQPATSRRIGVLMASAQNDLVSRVRREALEQELAKRGWAVGRNLQIDYRWSLAGLERAQDAAAELLGLHPDLIIAHTVPTARAAQKATRTVPIVFVGVSEPVFLGLVESLSHPGANITGFTNLEPSIGAKWAQLLVGIAPQVKRVGFLLNPDSTFATSPFYQSIEEAGGRLGVETLALEARQPADIEAGISRAGNGPGFGLIVQPDPDLVLQRRLIFATAARHRVPTIYPFDFLTREGGLMSYGPDIVDEFRRAASYVDRILRGEKAADLPVQQPIKFELLVNMKVAREIGLDVPPNIIATADELIE